MNEPSDTTPEVSHRDIIEAGGGSTIVAKRISEVETAAGRPPVPLEAVKGWKRVSSIPGRYWAAFAEAGICGLEDLAAAAAALRAA